MVSEDKQGDWLTATRMLQKFSALPPWMGHKYYSETVILSSNVKFTILMYRKQHHDLYVRIFNDSIINQDGLRIIYSMQSVNRIGNRKYVSISRSFLFLCNPKSFPVNKNDLFCIRKIRLAPIQPIQHFALFKLG